MRQAARKDFAQVIALSLGNGCLNAFERVASSGMAGTKEQIEAFSLQWLHPVNQVSS